MFTADLWMIDYEQFCQCTDKKCTAVSQVYRFLHKIRPVVESAESNTITVSFKGHIEADCFLIPMYLDRVLGVKGEKVAFVADDVLLTEYWSWPLAAFTDYFNKLATWKS